MTANIPNSLRKEIYRRDGYRCALCDSTRYLQIHHYCPRGKGGNDTPHNLITLCMHCHSHVHGRPLYDTPMSREEVDQACAEYLADYYLDEWWPYK